MKMISIAISLMGLLFAEALALDEIMATRNGFSSQGSGYGLRDLQSRITMTGSLDQRIERMGRELRLLKFQRDMFPQLGDEISYSGSNKPMADCVAELSEEVGKPLPLSPEDVKFTVGRFSFEGIPLIDVLKYLAAFGDRALDVRGNSLVCIPVTQLAGHSIDEEHLIDLIRAGDLAGLRQQLDGWDGDVSSITDSRGMNLLHHAVWQDQAEILTFLLGKGVAVNAQDGCGTTPLHQAVQMNRWYMVLVLLGAGADPAIVNTWNDSPIETALYKGDFGLATEFYRAGAPVDTFTAAGLGLMDKVREFLDAGMDWRKSARDHEIRGVTRLSDPRGRDPGSYMGAHGNSPLQWAAIGSSLEVARFLIARGEPVKVRNSQQETPLHWAARGGSPAMVELLITNGLSVSDRDSLGATPLHWASARGQMAAARVLIEHGADVNATNRFDRTTPLLLAARMADDPWFIKFLLEAGADVNARDDRKESALYKIAQFGARHGAEAARVLLDAGADVMAADGQGVTPLDEVLSAVKCHGNQELVNVLREATEKRLKKQE